MKKILLIIAAGLLAVGSAMDASPWHVEKRAAPPKGGGWLGVMIQDVTADLAKEKDLSVEAGAYVNEVVEDSPADSAGIEEGDVIVEFNGKKIASADDLTNAVSKEEPRVKVSIVLYRGKEKKAVTAILGKSDGERRRVIARTYRVPEPPAVPRVPRTPMPPRALARVFAGSTIQGMQLRTLDEQLAEYFGAPDKKGVLVESVKKDSKAEKAGFKAGDVIIKAGKKTVKRVGDITRAFGAYDEGEKVPVEILRKGAKSTLTIEADDEEDAHQFRFFGNPNGNRFWYGDDEGAHDFDVDVDVDVDDDDVQTMRIEIDGKKLHLEKIIEEAQREGLKEVEESLKQAGKELEKAAKEQKKTIRLKTKVEKSTDI